MAISFGSGAVKPYVGGSEIQEAYVGSQLVYRAKSPYTYRFLGTENNYVIDGTLLTGAAVTKEDGIYRIAFGYQGAFDFANVKGQSLKFTGKSLTGEQTVQIRGYKSGSTSITLIKNVVVPTQFTLIDCGTLSDWDMIRIQHIPSSNNLWIDAVRFEPSE